MSRGALVLPFHCHRPPVPRMCWPRGPMPSWTASVPSPTDILGRRGCVTMLSICGSPGEGVRVRIFFFLGICERGVTRRHVSDSGSVPPRDPFSRSLPALISPGLPLFPFSLAPVLLGSLCDCLLCLHLAEILLFLLLPTPVLRSHQPQGH